MGRPRKEDADAPDVKEYVDVAQEVYAAYVKGAVINDLAEEYKLDVQEVLGMIVTIEQNRKLNG